MNKLPLPQQNQIANLNNNLTELNETEILTGYVNNHEVQSNIHNYLFNRNGNSVTNLINLINYYTKNNKNLIPADLFSQNIPHLYYQFDDPIAQLYKGQRISDRHGNVYQLTKGWIQNNKAYNENSVELFENASFEQIKKYINKLTPAPTGNGEIGYNDFAKKMINSGLQFKLISKAQGYLWHKVSYNMGEILPIRDLIGLVNDRMLEQEMFLPMFNDLQSVEISWELVSVYTRNQKSNREWVSHTQRTQNVSPAMQTKYTNITFPLINIPNTTNVNRWSWTAISIFHNPYRYFSGIRDGNYKYELYQLKIYYMAEHQSFAFRLDTPSISWDRFTPIVMATKIHHIKIINSEQGNKHYE